MLVYYFVPYMLVAVSSGYKLQQWPNYDYQKYLNNFDGYTFYIAPYDFHWWSYLLGVIALFFAFYSAILLLRELFGHSVTEGKRW